MSYSEYQRQQSESIANCLTNFGCQPVIFAGAGLSIRYISGCNWIGLLKGVASKNCRVVEDVAYLAQKHGDLLKVAQELSGNFHEWAWHEGREYFDETLFNSNTPSSHFLKYSVCNFIRDSIPTEFPGALSDELQQEIQLLQNIQPHSIITTNFDTLCELLFPEYTGIVGQEIIRSPGHSIGEIFKIHGCITKYEEIIISSEDYKFWADRKKYLSAKLLTYFLEHPMLIVGYSLSDPNIKALLRDIDEILASPGKLVTNIYYLVYDENVDDNSTCEREAVLDLGDGKIMRVNAIHAKDYRWVFEAFQPAEGLSNINPRILRSFMARAHDLVRHDIPKRKIEVDYKTLEQVIENNEMLPTLLGIAALGSPEKVNADYPYTLTVVGERLGFKGWHGAHELLKQIRNEKEIDIRSSDNQYHVNVKTGKDSSTHKYSENLIQLLLRVKDGSPYDVQLINPVNPTS